MPPISPTSRESLTEKFHALLDECDIVADHALFGQTFDDLENFFLIQGRTFLREVLQEKLQERIEQTEVNDTPPCRDCKKNDHRRHQTENNSHRSRSSDD